MPNLCEQLQRGLQGRVCLMGLGNAEYGDDGLGVRLAEAVLKRLSRSGALSGSLKVLLAGTTPEHFIGSIAEDGPDHLVFLDAVEFGGAPGTVILLDAKQMAARFPQVSTHKISLGLVAKCVEAGGTTKAWLLGVQPESLRAGNRLTAIVQRTVEVLDHLLWETWGTEQSEHFQQLPAGRSIAEVDLC